MFFFKYLMHNMVTIYVFCCLYELRFLINVPLLLAKVPQKVRSVIQTNACLQERNDMMTLKQRLAGLCMRHILKFKEISLSHIFCIVCFVSSSCQTPENLLRAFRWINLYKCRSFVCLECVLVTCLLSHSH